MRSLSIQIKNSMKKSKIPCTSTRQSKTWNLSRAPSNSENARRIPIESSMGCKRFIEQRQENKRSDGQKHSVFFGNFESDSGSQASNSSRSSYGRKDRYRRSRLRSHYRRERFSKTTKRTSNDNVPADHDQGPIQDWKRMTNRFVMHVGNHMI